MFEKPIDRDTHLNPPEEPEVPMETCPYCDGDGEMEMTCPECFGEGIEECYECGGEGCDGCDDGVTDCGECWGSGEVIRKCIQCGGLGEIEMRSDDNE